MFEGISTLAKLKQDHPDTVPGQSGGVYETPADVVEGKVNPVESLSNVADESGLNEEAHSQDIRNRGSGEGRIIDLLG